MPPKPLKNRLNTLEKRCSANSTFTIKLEGLDWTQDPISLTRFLGLVDLS